MSDVLDAAKRGDLAGVRAGAERGTDLELRTERGATALLIASVLGHEEIASLLLKHSADVNAVNADGMTPIWAALSDQTGGPYSGIARRLVEAGADVDFPLGTRRGHDRVIAALDRFS